MLIHFYKYQGTGNDFILIDNRDNTLALMPRQIAFLCNRKLGIGADGLMLLENAVGFDFRMVYFNSDGNESTMCGNGGRCITAFAKRLGIVTNDVLFIATDGQHHATIHDDGNVSLQMQDVDEVIHGDSFVQLNTGSPHYIKFVEDIISVDVVTEGRRIRNLIQYQPKGINVNFVQTTTDGMSVRTYERGVEDETLSCGTGVTAAAIALNAGNIDGMYIVPILTPGGKLSVSYKKKNNEYHQVILKGMATYVFDGDINIL